VCLFAIAFAAPLAAAAQVVVNAEAGRSSNLPATPIDVTNDATHRWGEPEIAINPKNPNNIVYVAVGVGFTNACQTAALADPASPCALVNTAFGPQAAGLMNNTPGFSTVGVWVSFDRGNSWTKSLTIPGQLPIFPPDHHGAASSGDPLVAAGPDGTFYLGWDAIHFANLPKTIVDSGGIAVSKSKDGGLTWNTPVLVGTTIDRPFFASDLATGVIYEASTGQVPGPLASGDPNTPAAGAFDRYLVSTTDGVHWTSPRPFGGGGLGSRMSAAQGMLAAVFQTTPANNALCGKEPGPCTVFETTADGGVTWTRRILSVPNTYTSQPLVAADPSRPGHFTVALLMSPESQFKVYQTDDAGGSWSGPTTVTDDSAKSHYHDWMAYSPKGVLGLMWKTLDAPPGAKTLATYNVWVATSGNGGATFSQPLKISAAASPAPDARPFGNGGDDFSFIALGENEVFVGWADWRPAERSGFLGVASLRAFKGLVHH